MIDRASIKRAVRERLRGRVGRCFLACLIPMIIPLVFSLAGYSSENMSTPMLLFTSAITLFVTLPMQVTLNRFFLRFLYEENTPSPLTVTECFSREYGRCLGIQLWVMLCLFAWVLVPILLISIGMAYFASANMDMLYGMVMIVYIVGIGCLLNRWFAYSMAFYLLAEFPACGVRQAVRISKTLTHGYKWPLFVLQLSFILWQLLVAVTFGIANVYVLPYINGVQAAFYVEMRTRHPDRLGPMFDNTDSSGGEDLNRYGQ